MRVKVWKFVTRPENDFGRDEVYLGEGELIGEIPLLEICSKEEYIQQFKSLMDRFKIPISQEQLDKLFLYYEKLTTPKIVLDTGEVVYGFAYACRQVSARIL